MSTFIPKISYQTWLDRYVVLAMVLVFGVFLETFLVSGSFGNFPFVDIIFFEVCTAVWLAVHVYIFIGSRCGWFLQSWQSVLAGGATAYYFLLASHFLLLTTYYLLLTTYYVLRTTYYVLLTTYYLLSYYVLLTTYYYYLLLTTYLLLATYLLHGL